MTTPEERRLAELLHGSAELLDTDGSALETIRTGVRRRRARRRLALSGAAAVVTGALVATVALGGGTTASLDPAPQATSGPSSSPSPSASPRPADLDGSTTSQPGTPFFPFTTDEQAADWAAAPGDQAWASDPVQVAQHLVDDLLDLEDGRAVRDTCLCDGRALVSLQSGDEAVGTVDLAQLGTGAVRPWVVVRVASADGGRPLAVKAPDEGAPVSSPLEVVGTVPGVDESVQVRLRTTAGALLAEAFAPAGSEAPWSASLSWTARDWTTGVVIAMTRSPRDGSVSRLVAVPVLRDTTTRAVPGPTEAFVGEVDGKVGLYAADDGRLLQQVSFPPAGYNDTSPRRSGTKVLWIRVGRECADRRVISRDLATVETTTLVADSPLALGALAVSPSGAWTAWAVRPGCEQGPTTITVTGPGGGREVEQDENGDVADLELRDDGTLLIGIAGEDGGYVGLDGDGRPAAGFEPQMDCLVFNGAFLGDRVVALELCDPFSASPQPLKRVEFSLTGKRLSTAQTSLESVARLTTAGDEVLVQRFEPSGAIGRLVGTRFEPLLEQPACAETLEAKGCLTAIDW